MTPTCRAEFLQQLAEFCLLLVRKHRRCFRNDFSMICKNLLKELFAFGRQFDNIRTAVLFAGDSSGQALFREVIDDDCHISAADKLLFTELTDRHWAKVSECFEGTKLRLSKPKGPDVFRRQFVKRGKRPCELYPHGQRQVCLGAVL